MTENTANDTKVTVAPAPTKSVAPATPAKAVAASNATATVEYVSDDTLIRVVNRKGMIVTLRSKDGEEITLPPTRKVVTIPAKFLLWVKPPSSVVSIMDKLTK